MQRRRFFSLPSFSLSPLMFAWFPSSAWQERKEESEEGASSFRPSPNAHSLPSQSVTAADRRRLKTEVGIKGIFRHWFSPYFTGASQFSCPKKVLFEGDSFNTRATHFFKTVIRRWNEDFAPQIFSLRGFGELQFLLAVSSWQNLRYRSVHCASFWPQPLVSYLCQILCAVGVPRIEETPDM